MKYDIAMKWADALEGGDYKQGQRRLKTPKGYCCLGVLCDISGVGQWNDDGSFTTYQSGEVVGLDGQLLADYAAATLTENVKEWAGMRSVWGSNPKTENLAQLNDQGKTFKEIAAIIRENWETL